MNNFCLLPFTHFSTRPNGDITPCCRYHGDMGNIRKNTLEEIWNSDKFIALRSQFRANQRPEGCWQCWELEDSGGTSMRQTMLANRQYPKSVNTIQPFTIPVIELKLSNLCNFRCRTCKPDLSTTWNKDWDIVKSEYDLIGQESTTDRLNFFQQDHVLKSISELAKHLEILEFAGGEPLMDPLHYQILELIKPYATNIEIKYSTNLSRLAIGKWNVLDFWKDFKRVDLSISLDGTPALNDYIRTESDTVVIKENLSIVRKELRNRFIGRIALCFSAFNAWHLPEAYEYFSCDLNMPIHGNIAHGPIFINPQILPSDLKRSIVQRYDDFSIAKDKLPISTPWKKRIDRFLTTNKNYMIANDQSSSFDQFLRFISKLDQSRNTNFFKLVPEYEKYK